MVKREKSPDLPEDAKYLVVHQPYPLNANFELPSDHVAFALWAATVLGEKERVLGVHHKPARATVLLEVERSTPLSGMLGEHRWNEMLRTPREEEKDRVSRVYFSVYRTGRDTGKDGWKRIEVDPRWFVKHEWRVDSGPMVYPYPNSHWCSPLAEDPTLKKIARPLPVKFKPPPPTAPSLVPGSAEWTARNDLSNSQQQGRRRGRGRGGGPPVMVPGSAEWVQAGRDGRATGEQQPRGKGRGRGAQRGRERGGDVTGTGRGGARGGNRGAPVNVHEALSRLAAGNTNPWYRIEPSSSSTPSTAGSSTVGRGGYPAAPPGLTCRSNTARSSVAYPAAPPGLTRVRESLAGMSLSEDQDDEDEEAGEPVSYVPFDRDSDDEDDEYFDDVGAALRPYEPSVFSDSTFRSEKESGPVNLWADSEETKDVDEKEKEPMCAEHGILCKKGICALYAKLKRERLRAQEAAERAERIKEAKQKRKKKKNNKGKQKETSEGQSDAGEKSDGGAVQAEVVEETREDEEEEGKKEVKRPKRVRRIRKRATAAV